MSEFLTQSALASRLVEKTGVSPETAKNFSTLFFNIVRKALKEENSFSVYNFGTFKKTWIETTIGLNPQTGVKIEIPAHWRIKFVPCAAVARRINKPYAHLKPKVIREKKQKVTDDGLYAKASKYSENSSEDEETNKTQEAVLPPKDDEKLGLLAAAESMMAEKAVREAEKEEPEIKEETPSVIDEPEITEDENAISENEVISDEDNDIDEDDYDDDEIEEKKDKKPLKILFLAGAAVLIIILLISLLIKACKEPKNKEKDTLPSQKNEKPEEDKLTEKQDDSTEITPTENIETEPVEVEKDFSEEDEIDSEIFESYVVPTGGNFHKIAEKSYGNRHLWPVIYSANKSINSDPDFVSSYTSIKIPAIQEGEAEQKKVAEAMLDAYNGYLLMCEKQPDSPKNELRKNRAIRVIVSAELVQEGFIEKYKNRILPEYADMARRIVKNQYKR